MSDYYNKDKIFKKNEELKQYSPKFCIAKLKQSFLYLHTGLNHSCYLTKSHPSELSESEPSRLHNTLFNKVHRLKLMQNQWPADCQHCSNVENHSDKHISDRMLRNFEDWAKPIHEDDVKKSLELKNITPSYVEISFSNKCNLQCSYCAPVFSSKWVADLEENGVYESQLDKKESIEFTLAKIREHDSDDNPYIKQFWKWLPELYLELRILRLTGGEPLLSKETFKLINWIHTQKTGHILDEFSVNTNLSIPMPNLKNNLSKLDQIAIEGKIKEVLIFASIDSWGPQVEYSRLGLNLKTFEENLIYTLDSYPNINISLMVTYNIFSVHSFRELIERLILWRKMFPSKTNVPRIQLDIPILLKPNYLSCLILDDSFEQILESDLEYMKSQVNNGLEEVEIQKFERILLQFRTRDKVNVDKKKSLFYLYVVERDKRKGLNFLEIFPELKDFFLSCEEKSRYS